MPACKSLGDKGEEGNNLWTLEAASYRVRPLILLLSIVYSDRQQLAKVSGRRIFQLSY